VDVWIIFNVGSGMELKHIHLRGGLAAGAFTGAAGVGRPWFLKIFLKRKAKAKPI
jgi:hypothetical protein